MGKGAATRERILEIAEAAVLAKGFGATSIDEVIAEAGITKSGFFYHFKDKNELAREMVRRYVETNDQLFDEIFDRGKQLSDDPLQAFLIGLKLMAEIMADLPNGHPGCLIASICYQERLFDREIRELNAQAVEAGTRGSWAISKTSRPCIRRASRCGSPTSPTCCHASSTAASSCRRH